MEEKSLGWKTDSPSNSSPFPSFAVATIFRSMVLTPTVRSHGASLDNVVLEGPEFPAGQPTNVPFFIAANAPIAMLSWKNGTASTPRESESTSTSSSIAASSAASMLLSPQSSPKHTL
ncbi:hypothetical protein SCA6_005227 [Theobroma cacao]